MRRVLAYKYRLYPNRVQIASLEEQLRQACVLYNAALQERRDAWQMCRRTINYYDQAEQLKAIRADGALTLANFNACQDVLRRVDKAFADFFRRVKNGKNGRLAGYPRFKSSRRYDSYTFPQYGNGCKLKNGRLHLQGVGEIKLKLHRTFDGCVKTVTIQRDADRWFACFNIETTVNKQLPNCDAAIGIDLGLEHFAVLSDGKRVSNPRYRKCAQSRLRRASRKLARRKLGSCRRHKARMELQRAHAHVRYQRADFNHKVARQLVDQYGVIAVEDLNVKGLANGMLAGPIRDAAWGDFLRKLSYKAEDAGRTLIKVNPYGTSQRCPCGAPVTKELWQHWHHCESCGLSVPRDHAAAMEILRLGLSLQASTMESSNVA